MADNQKDLTIKMGLDGQAVNNGLDKVAAKVNSASANMAKSLDKTTESAKKLGQQLESAGKSSGAFSRFNVNGLATAAIGAGTMLAKNYAKNNFSESDNSSAQSVLNGIGIGGMAGMQMGGPWGAVIGSLGGAAVGLQQAANNLNQATSEEKRNANNVLYNNESARTFLDDTAKKNQREEFLSKMADSSISSVTRLQKLTEAQNKAQIESDRAKASIEKMADPNSSSATLDPSVLLKKQKLFTEAENDIKLFEKLKEAIKSGGLNKSKNAVNNLSRSDAAGMATNELTRVGLGVNGLNNLSSVQLKTNELVSKSNDLLAKIEAKTGVTTWA